MDEEVQHSLLMKFQRSLEALFSAGEPFSSVENSSKTSKKIQMEVVEGGLSDSETDQHKQEPETTDVNATKILNSNVT